MFLSFIYDLFISKNSIVLRIRTTQFCVEPRVCFVDGSKKKIA